MFVCDVTLYHYLNFHQSLASTELCVSCFQHPLMHNITAHTPSSFFYSL